VKRLALAALAAVPLAAAPAGEDPSPPLVHEVALHASVEEVWRVFTTSEGWKSFGIAHASVDFRVGGKVLTHYDPKGVLGDANTIENTILAFEPHSWISFRATKAPKGFPFPAEVMERTWSVASFRDLGDGRTRLSLRGHGYGSDEDSKRMRQFFERGNAMTLAVLAKRYPAPADAGDGPIEISGVVEAGAADAFRAWTTAEGWKAALGVDARIGLSVGGPFEIAFLAAAPEGRRGSEGCTVQAWLPGRMLAFTWNAPPLFPAARAARTLVVVEFEAEGPGRTRVRLTHDGWRERIAASPSDAKEWRAVRAYFENAWPRVLEGFAGAAGPGK
jgi:uncharacterized protein YndB with AHSA1/START domain